MKLKQLSDSAGKKDREKEGKSNKFDLEKKVEKYREETIF
jgi:hypothetical protein